jgi:uncharacterized repeat protein (TIGR03806 family)
LPAIAQTPGIDQVVAVAPFLNGALPTRRPLDPSSTDWTVNPTFTNLDIDNTLVIEPNPANNNLYVGSRDGYIQFFDNNPATTQTTPFLDLRDRVGVVWDGGFLGLEFHPDYGKTGAIHENYVYVYYSARCGIVGPHPTKTGGWEIEGENAANPCKPQAEIPGNFGDSQSQYFFDTYLRLSRFEVNPLTGVADRDSEIIMLNIRLYNGSHRGGGIEFADDGYLWLTIGDQFRYETAQDITNTLEGGVLRLALDITENGDGTWTCPAGSHQPIRRMNEHSAENNIPGGVYEEISGNYYCIPDDNPWLDPTGNNYEEYATIGHRNPHRMTKDPLTGRLWSGEIGSSKREEINVIELGNNYGWPFREGLGAGVRNAPGSYLGVLTDPVLDFSRTEAQAIIGGYVYRGTRFPELYGKYLAGDYPTNKIYAITLDEATMTATKEQLTTFSPGGLGTWGQDNQGEILLGDVHTSNMSLYTLERIGEPVEDAPPLLSQVGAFDDLPGLDVADYFVPFNLAQPFWSDNAYKQRWIALPNNGDRNAADEQIVFSPDSNWQFPVGTVLMKHFEMPLDENDPSVRERLETRFLVNGDDGNWYGLTYRWLPDLSDAVLLTTDETRYYTIQTATGGTRQQPWLYPSRDQCVSCHTGDGGGPLGTRTHQLNSSIEYPDSGIVANQLLTWSHLDMFDVSLTQADVDSYLKAASLEDATASLELRSRSWLDSNCSYCHRPETGRAVFDARLTTPLENQSLINGIVADDFGIPGAHVITPGDPDSSIAWLRLAEVGGGNAMPPLAKALADQKAVEVIREWIERVDAQAVSYGAVYEYYETGQLSVLPDFNALTPTAVGISADFDISNRFRGDDFAFRFTAKLYAPQSGDYTFWTNSDDGSQLWINNQLVVDNDGLHGPTEVSGGINLAEGYHDIVVTMFERGGGEVLDVHWAGPGFAYTPVPAGNLFQEIPQPPVENLPPAIVGPGNIDLLEGETVNISLIGTDPDSASLYYSANNLPPGISLNGDTGYISGTVAAAATGSYDLVVGVSDGPGVASATAVWNVLAPVVIDQPVDQIAFAGDLITMQITTSSAGPLTFSATGLPGGLAIDSSSGEITGTVDAASAGNNAVTVYADNGTSVIDVSFNWAVYLPSPGDQDGDGIPDDYEFSYGLDPLVYDSDLDPDGDGVSSLDEYLNGTNPVVFDVGGVPLSFAVQIAAVNDDAEEGVVSGVVNSGSSDLEMIDDGEEQLVGLRFNGIPINTGAVIADAWVQFTVDEADSVATSLLIEGQAGPATNAFRSATPISGRPRTTASVSWEPAPWVNVGDAGSAQRTPNLAPVLMEIINDPAWSEGQSVALIVSGTGKRVADAHDGAGGVATAAVLHIDYLYPVTNTPPVVTVTTPADGTEVGNGYTVDLVATATDDQDGDMAADISWASSLDGLLGTGGNITVSLTLGTHTVTASVTDSGGESHSDAITVVVTPSVTNDGTVVIDIVPDDPWNWVDTATNDPLAVAVLSTSSASGDAVDFDSQLVDGTTVLFGPLGAQPVDPVGVTSDVDADGDLDKTFIFDSAETGILCEDETADLSAETYGGEAIHGSDLVEPTACPTCHP